MQGITFFPLIERRNRAQPPSPPFLSSARSRSVRSFLRFFSWLVARRPPRLHLSGRRLSKGFFPSFLILGPWESSKRFCAVRILPCPGSGRNPADLLTNCCGFSPGPRSTGGLTPASFLLPRRVSPFVSSVSFVEWRFLNDLLARFFLVSLFGGDLVGHSISIGLVAGVRSRLPPLHHSSCISSSRFSESMMSRWGETCGLSQPPPFLHLLCTDVLGSRSPWRTRFFSSLPNLKDTGFDPLFGHFIIAPAICLVERTLPRVCFLSLFL